MKVNIVSTFNRNCGIGQYTEHLGKQLNACGTDVHVYRKDDPDDQTFHTYSYRSFRSWQHRVAPFFLKRAIQNLEADLWHADYVSSFQALDWSGIGKPLIVTAHDAIPFLFPGKSLDFSIYKHQMKRAIKKAKYLVTVSETARQDLIQHTGVNPLKVVSIPNGINVSDFENQEGTTRNEVFTIRYLGGLGAPHKNVPMLLHMAQILEKQGLSFRLELGGYLPEKHFLRDLAEKLELKNISFPGFIPDEDKAAFLGGADLFAFPSLMEGFGFPPMEAMASGTAILASNIPVFEELLGSSAALVEPTAEQFAKAVMQFIASDGQTEDLAKMGQEHVRNYSWEQVAHRTSELYQLAIK